MFWIALPEAPLTRLSIALIITKFDEALFSEDANKEIKQLFV